MTSKLFFKYIKDNMDKILSNFEKVLNINSKDLSDLINIIIRDIVYDKFYEKLLLEKIEFNNFEESFLLELKYMFINLGINEIEIKKIILTIPEVLLFSDKLEDIYPIYKNNEFKGISFINSDEYRAYSYSLSSYKLRYLNSTLDRKQNNYDYLMESLLNSLKRKDLEERLDLRKKEHIKLKDKFTALTRKYSKKNYYFKRI